MSSRKNRCLPHTFTTPYNLHKAFASLRSAVFFTFGGGTIILRDGDGRIPVVATDRIPALRDKRYDALSAMFAAAMAHALGKTADEIREGLCAFEPAGATTPAVDDADNAAPGDDVEQPNKSPVRDAG